MSLSQTFLNFETVEAAEPRAREVLPSPRRNAVRMAERVSAAEIEESVISLYEEMAPALLRYVTAVCRDESLAHDAVQESFLRYYAALVRGEDVRHRRAWLYRVARNYALDRRKEYAARNCFGMKGRELDELPSRGPQLEEEYLRSEVLEYARRLLSPRELECLQLRAEGLRYQEIAQILRLRSGTVGTMLARGLDKIRKVVRSSAR